MDLGDADTDQPITAKLQYADIGSENWQDCPSIGNSTVSLSYGGTEATWSGDWLLFDVYQMDLGGAEGMMKQVRIAVDYSLPDGSKGTVYSTDCSRLFAYTGNYITSVSSSYSSNTVSCTFRINTDLVMDLSKLELVLLTLTSMEPDSSNIRNILNDADVTAFANDGTFTVTYPLSGETLKPEDRNELVVAFDYEDYNGSILWYSTASAALEVTASPFAAPVLDSANVEKSASAGYSYVPFAVTVNDGTKYGDLTATLQHWNGSAFTTFAGGSDAVGTLTLPQNDSTAAWTTSSSGSCLIADLAADNSYDFVRVTVGYTDDSGQAVTLTGDPMVIYKGNYVTPVEKDSRYVGDNYIEVYFQVDPDLVRLANVETVSLTVTDSNGSEVVFNDEEFLLDKDTGLMYIYGEVEYEGSDTDTEPPTVTVRVDLLYTDSDVGPVKLEWAGSSSLDIPLVFAEYVPPELISFDLTSGGSDSAVFRMPFNLLMNDAESVTAAIYWSASKNGTYSLLDAPNGTVTLTHDNTTDPVDYWVTSSSGEVLLGNVPWSDDLPGAIGWFKILFTYTMPDGMTDSFFTDYAIPKWAGSFFDYASSLIGYAPGNYIDSTWNAYPQLTPSQNLVTVQSVRLVPNESDVSEVLPQSGDISLTAEDGYYYVTINDPELDNVSWKLELTMNYSDGEINWTASQTVPVAFID